MMVGKYTVIIARVGVWHAEVCLRLAVLQMRISQLVLGDLVVCPLFALH